MTHIEESTYHSPPDCILSCRVSDPGYRTMLPDRDWSRATSWPCVFFYHGSGNEANRAIISNVLFKR